MAREWAELHWEKIKYFLLKTSRCEEAKGEKKKQKQKKNHASWLRFLYTVISSI